MALPAYFQPNALDFRPVTSAVQNYGQAMERRFDHQTGELVGARLAVNDLAGAQAIAAQRGDLASSVRLRQLGQEDERFQFARELHPLQVQAQRLQSQAAQQSIAQSAAMHPLQLQQTNLAIKKLQDEMAAIERFRAQYDGIPSPEAARLPGAAAQPVAPPSSATDIMRQYYGGTPRSSAAPPPSPSGVTTPQVAAAAPRVGAPNVDEFGQRFIQDHIINVPPEIGESRFGVLLNDPVFGPAFRTHGYHQIPWRDAATAIAGVTTAPPTVAPVTSVPGAGRFAQPGLAVPAPRSLVPPLPAQPPAQVDPNERLAHEMIATGLPGYIAQGRQMLDEINKNRPERIIAREAAQERGKLLGQAQVNLPAALQAGESILRNVDAVLDERGLGRHLPSALGGIQSRMPTFSSNTAAVEARLDQLHGQTFLQAFERLRGSGQISEGEGRAATAAFARLGNRIQDPAAYRLALEDARREVHEVMNLARQRAGQPVVPFIPYGAINDLRGTPARAADFDRKYGTPSDPAPSRRYIGTQ